MKDKFKQIEEKILNSAKEKIISYYRRYFKQTFKGLDDLMTKEEKKTGINIYNYFSQPQQSCERVYVSVDYYGKNLLIEDSTPVQIEELLYEYTDSLSKIAKNLEKIISKQKKRKKYII